jgi:hypothetical protein
MWLLALDDVQLQSGLGLTLEDIAVLRWYAAKSTSLSLKAAGSPNRLKRSHVRLRR